MSTPENNTLNMTLGLSKELAHWRMKTWKTFKKGESWAELQKTQ